MRSQRLVFPQGPTSINWWSLTKIMVSAEPSLSWATDPLKILLSSQSQNPKFKRSRLSELRAYAKEALKTRNLLSPRNQKMTKLQPTDPAEPKPRFSKLQVPMRKPNFPICTPSTFQARKKLVGLPPPIKPTTDWIVWSLKTMIYSSIRRFHSTNHPKSKRGTRIETVTTSAVPCGRTKMNLTTKMMIL